jgi:membrane-associated phospholipid phosphatase
VVFETRVGTPDIDKLRIRPLMVAAGICGALFIVLAVAITAHSVPNIVDRSVGGRLLAGSEESRRFEIAVTGSDIGSPAAVVTAGLLLAAVCWWYTRRWRLALLCVAAPGLAGLLAESLLKPIVARPAQGTDISSQIFSFPSGHTAGATGLAVAIILVAWIAVPSKGLRNLLIAGAALYALTVGVAQIIIGAHWTTDVIGGLLLGTFVAVAVALGLAEIPAERPSAIDDHAV